MSRVGRFAIALTLASSLGMGAASAASLDPLLGGDATPTLNSGVGGPSPQFNPFGPNGLGFGIFPTVFTGLLGGEIDHTANLSLSVYSASNTDTGGLSVSFLPGELPISVKFTYLGSEAGNANASFAGGALFNQTTDVGTSTTVAFGNPPLSASPAFLPFSFGTNGAFSTCGAGPGIAAVNGGADTPCTVELKIAILRLGPSVAYAFFEDGVNPTDNDFDDFVMRIEILPPGGGEIPVPPAAILFGSALAGMGLLGMRRRRSRQG